MAKFSGSSVAPGQVSEEQAAAIAGSPVADLQEQVPQAGPSETLNSIIAQQPQPSELPEVAPEEVPAVQEELERSAIAPIRERLQDEQRVDTYERAHVKRALPQEDGGLMSRARGMANAIENRELTISKKIETNPEVEKNPLMVGEILTTVGAQQNTFTPDGRYDVNYDPKFWAVTSVVTENFLADNLVGEGLSQEELQQNLGPDAEEITVGPGQNTAVTKTQGNARLGRQIADEYARTAGQPAPQLSNEQAVVLGDAAKEAYAQQNPDIVKRVASADGSQVVYQLTPEGNDKLQLGLPQRKRMFPKQHVRPQKAPLGELVGDVARERKNETGTVGKKTHRQKRGRLNEAKKNLNTVPNVVDVQRSRILLSTVLPVLADQQGPLTNVFAEINNVGPSKQRKFQAAETKALQNGEQYSAVDEMSKLKDTLAQSIFGIARERNGANYLTYYTQAYNGRLSPQQTHFDPTTSKAVRFVTRNATPAKVVKGGRVDRNLRQMYAMMLVKGADTKLPDERERMLEANMGKLKMWGKRLEEVLDQTMTPQQAEQIMAQIEQGTPITQLQFQPLALDPERDAELIKAINEKGEDGPHFIDGLIDLSKYADAMENGRPYHSYFNAYIDGKTNGLAANGIQMGSEAVALTTGVIRNQNVDLLDDGDIRDQLKSVLLSELSVNGIFGVQPELSDEFNDVAQAVFSWRDLNKATTMTFGYGQEMAAFAGKIDETMGELYEIARSGDQELIAKHGLETFAESYDTLMESMDEPSILSQTLLRPYSAALTTVLSEEGIKARALMKGAATVHALLGEVFTIQTYSGMDLNFGGEVSFTTKDEMFSYYLNEQAKQGYLPQSRATAAAPKVVDGEVQIGRKAIGGSVPGPVQSLDAETIALSVTGKSWDRLRMASNGNPYFHSIYDAIKMDANGYDVVLSEVNNNWLKAAMKWSYLQEMYDATKETIKVGDKKLAELGAAQVDTSQTGEYAMVGYLLGLEPSQKGNMIPKKLFSALKTTMWQKPGELEEDFNSRVWGVTFKMKDTFKAYATPDGGPVTMPATEVRRFFQMYLRANNFGDRFRGMIEQTNNNKKKLAKKIRSSGPVYQYYAH